MGLSMNMNKSNIQFLSAILFILSLYNPALLASSMDDTVPFSVNYSPTWGSDHLTALANETQVQLLLDEHSGAGFNSKNKYGSGIFRMKMKLPKQKDAGVITTFYLTGIPTGQPGGGPHDEVDLEFLGGNGERFTLSTNVFANDNGGREQQFALWFDPSDDFHVYEILWNQHQIAFFVDKIPIRVFPNLQAQLGVNYPSQPMHVETSIWNFTSWQGPVDWSQGPFVAEYRGFGVEACVDGSASDPQGCFSPNYYWNAPQYWQLDPVQQMFLNDYVRKNHMIYDYCVRKNKRHLIECKAAGDRFNFH